MLLDWPCLAGCFFFRLEEDIPLMNEQIGLQLRMRLPACLPAVLLACLSVIHCRSADISTTCLQQLRDAAAAEGIAQSRIAVFPADATDPAATPLFDGIEADALLIMFTLSAVMPPQQQVMLSHAWRALRPGGRLYIRDHGLYDMVQLRIPPEQWIGPNLYKRGDGR